MSSQQVNLNFSLLNSKIREKEWENVSNYIKKSFAVQYDDTGLPLTFNHDPAALNILHQIFKIYLQNECSHEDLLLQTTRALRNCVTNKITQEFISTSDFLNTLENVYHKIYKSNPENTFKIFLQLLVNLSVKNSKGSKWICSKFNLFDLLDKEMHVHEVSAILYYISFNDYLNLDLKKLNKILHLYETQSKVEFLHFLLEKVLQYDIFWESYEILDLKYRIIILEIIRENQTKQNHTIFSKEGVLTLIKVFLNSSDIIFNTVSSNTEDRPYEVSLILQIISESSGDESYLTSIYQSNSDLLINTAMLLINIHRLGKASDNCFTQVKKPSEICEQGVRHPVFGFKADLVRLIGNMCWKCKKMQDLTREAEVIPVILDCCNIDANNPFIMQWSIFAIRNICENNLENQEIIAGMHKKGTVDSNILAEAGLAIHSDGKNQIRIVGIDDIKDLKIT